MDAVLHTVGYMKVSTPLTQSCHNLQEVVLCTQEMTRFFIFLAHSMARQRGVFHYMHNQEEIVGNSVLWIILSMSSAVCWGVCYVSVYIANLAIL